jgi:hypothetical protein
MKFLVTQDLHDIANNDIIKLGGVWLTVTPESRVDRIILDCVLKKHHASHINDVMPYWQEFIASHESAPFGCAELLTFLSDGHVLYWREDAGDVWEYSNIPEEITTYVSTIYFFYRTLPHTSPPPDGYVVCGDQATAVYFLVISTHMRMLGLPALNRVVADIHSAVRLDKIDSLIVENQS